MLKPITIMLLLLGYLTTGHNCFALDLNSLVYANEKLERTDPSYKNIWKLRRYVGTRDDCLMISRSNDTMLVRRHDKFGDIILEGQFEVGGEVYYKFSNPDKPLTKYRVLSTGLTCHMVQDKDDEIASRTRVPFYILPANIIEQNEFEKFIGLKSELIIKEEVLRLESREGWKPAVVAVEQNDCFATDSGKVLHPGVSIFVPPKKTEKIKAGDNVLLQSKDVDGTLLNIWRARDVKSVAGYKVTLARNVDTDEQNTGATLEATDTLKADEVIAINEEAKVLSYWSSLKPGTEIFLYVTTESCVGEYYERHKIVSEKKKCYLLKPDWHRDDPYSSDAEMPNRLIPVKDLEAFIATPGSQ